MYVYSGKCRLCDCGLDTGRVDVMGKPLFTGDIVITYTDNYGPDVLTVIVSDQYQTYSNGTHELTGKNNFYPMGIKNVWVDGDNVNKWIVRKLKDHSEVVDGENWTAWKFRFKNDSPTLSQTG